MPRRTRQRSKTEIISSILRSTHNRTGVKISQILYETCIPYNQLKEYLTMMVQNKLIMYIKDGKVFKITEYGVNALKLYGEMDKLLVYKPTKQSVEY
jgi:predicted transcriptional regulator